MKISIYKSYDDLPLFLNAETVAQVLGVSISSAYELLHEPGFPVVRVGSRMVVPKKVRCLGVRPGGKRCARLKLPVMKPYVSRRRFSLPNEIWTWKLRPPAFAVLAYLQYRCCRKFGGAVTMEELAEQTRMSAGMAKASVDALTKKGLLTTDLLPLLPGTEGRNFFSLPDEVFHLGLGHSALDGLRLPALLRGPPQPPVSSQLQHHLSCHRACRQHCDETHQQAGGTAVYRRGAHQLH